MRKAPSPSSSVVDFVGNTPIIKLQIEVNSRIYHMYAKLEFMNPSGSVKDRIAKYMIDSAENRGILKPNSIIVEATSGNTGIALAMVAAAKGYRMVVFMPEHMSKERIRLMESLGAEVCLTPKEDGFEGAVRKTEEVAKRSSIHVYLTKQFSNDENVAAHYKTTGREIIAQVPERVDLFVAGVGTGGTLFGVGKALREVNPQAKLVAVEPAEAALLSGETEIHDHKIAGIGDGFIPEIVKTGELDLITKVKSDDAVDMSKRLCKEYGLMVGISSGANILGVVQALDKIGRDKVAVTVLPDRTERYFSTDLHVLHQHLVHRCTPDCQCIFS
ncbi:MAG TPA: cysteine synthase A [Methylomirabilota bacterium]|nr:cysteine synthase A [Methylomirabilota bacterium]